MARRRTYPPLRVYLGSQLAGLLLKEPGGAVSFRYEAAWLARANAIPVSLSLPLREEAYRGEPVSAVFENLLPDSDVLRRRIAEKVGARGVDAFSLLTRIGRDCVGAFQFVPDDEERVDDGGIDGEAVDEADIERLLRNLAQAPLGIERDDSFRISLAGAQEKTALLRNEGRWLKPRGTTPTTHIFKTQIGVLPDGINLSDSVENEFYCLKLAEAFGLPVAAAEMQTFGETKTLVIERFDRRWTGEGRLLRLPQEDCCQALSVLPTLKYQRDGGPGMSDVLDLLRASDTPLEDQETFLAAQLFFWVIGATDGHAKNFSIFLMPGGAFHLTPLYDILTVQPLLDAGQIRRRQMRLAMSAGDSRHYRVDEIHPRHFLQTAGRANVPKSLVMRTLERIADIGERAFRQVEETLPADFPERFHASVRATAMPRIAAISSSLGLL
jgi:serine/threonine-protein kinase HipA